MEKNLKQGGFSDEVWNQTYLQEYISSGLVFGYFSGNYFRRDKFDSLVENTLVLRGWSALEIAYWITSTGARHFQDQVDSKTTLKEMKEFVKQEFTNYAVKEGIVPAKPEQKKAVSDIVAFMHCGKCLNEIPNGESAQSFARFSIGWTRKGLHVWCNRHDLNVINLDFKGQKVGAI